VPYQQSHGEANIKRYDKGRGPLGFPNWPYNKFEISHDTVMHNINGQLGGISTECPAPPTPEPDDEDFCASRPNSPLMYCHLRETPARKERIQEYNCMCAVARVVCQLLVSDLHLLQSFFKTRQFREFSFCTGC